MGQAQAGVYHPPGELVPEGRQAHTFRSTILSLCLVQRYAPFSTLLAPLYPSSSIRNAMDCWSSL